MILADNSEAFTISYISSSDSAQQETRGSSFDDYSKSLLLHYPHQFDDSPSLDLVTAVKRTKTQQPIFEPLARSFQSLCAKFAKVNCAGKERSRLFLEACDEFVRVEGSVIRWQQQCIDGGAKPCDALKELKLRLAKVIGPVSASMLSRYRAIGNAYALFSEESVFPHLPLSSETLYYLARGRTGTGVTREDLDALRSDSILCPTLTRSTLRKLWAPKKNEAEAETSSEMKAEARVILHFSKASDVESVLKALADLQISTWTYEEVTPNKRKTVSSKTTVAGVREKKPGTKSGR